MVSRQYPISKKRLLLRLEFHMSYQAESEILLSILLALAVFLIGIGVYRRRW